MGEEEEMGNLIQGFKGIEARASQHYVTVVTRLVRARVSPSARTHSKAVMR